MNLTTWSFIAPVIALAVLSLGLSSWLLGRVTSWKRRIAAVGGFALTLVLVSASIGLVANRNMMWVSTVDDLFLNLSQPENQGKVTVHEPSSGESARESADPEDKQSQDKHADEQALAQQLRGEIPAAREVTATDRSEQNAFTYDPATNLWHATFHGTSSGLTRSVTMWLPEGVTPDSSIGGQHNNAGAAGNAGTAHTSGSAGEKLNVILFNHGYPGTDEGVVNALAIDKILGNAVKSGQLPPTAFVVPDIGVGGPPDCVDIAGRPPIETFFTRDVPRILLGQLPNVSHQLSSWTLAGISSGAYCAPVLQIRHTDSFFAALSIGGYDRPLLGSLSRSDQQTKAAYTISTMVARQGHQESDVAGSAGSADTAAVENLHSIGARVRLFIAGATNDKDSRELVANLAGLKEANADLGFDLDRKGGHSWSTWKRQLPKALAWLAQERTAYLQARAAVEAAHVGGDGAGSSRGSGAEKDNAATRETGVDGVSDNGGSDGSAASSEKAANGDVNSQANAARRGDGAGSLKESTDLEQLKQLEEAKAPGSADPPLFELRGIGTLVLLSLISVLAVVLLIAYGSRITVTRSAHQPKYALASASGRSPHKSWREVAVFVARAILILFVAVFVFFTLFAIDNRSEVYFATWEDLVAHWIDLFIS